MTSNKQPWAVVDTNVFISSLLKKQGQPFVIVKAFRAHMFTLVMCAGQLYELRDTFSRPSIQKRCHLSPSEVGDLLFLIDIRSIRVPGTMALPVAVRDPKDEKILASALEGKADYLVTGDYDLLVLNGDPLLGNLQIVKVRDFLIALSSIP